MLFAVGDNIIESEKERNLYYKFFAGYFLNELVPGWESRLEGFQKVLHDAARATKQVNIERIALSPASTHISFDNYTYLLVETADRGEFADIMVHDWENRVIIAIEAKFLSDWSFSKDVERNAARLTAISGLIPDATVIQCLLVTKNKLENARRAVKRPESGLRRLEEITGNHPLIVTWESLLPWCADLSVHTYLQYQLALPKRARTYEVREGQFTRRRSVLF